MKKLLLLIIPFLCFGQIDYESQIQPILNAQCIGCHQGDATYSGGLNLTSYDDLMDGGYTQGGVVTTGLLEDYITTGYMPAYGSGNSLYETEINLIIQWISEGANYIENCNSDIDNDGICDQIDNCPEIFNPSQNDEDDPGGSGDDCDGINILEESISNIRIFPNPSSSVIYVNINNSLSKDGYVQLTDEKGSLVKKIKTTGQETIKINTKTLSTGLYFINIVDNSKILIEQKIIITR